MSKSIPVDIQVQEPGEVATQVAPTAGRNMEFVGREAEFKQLDSYLLPRESIPVLTYFTISGMAGVGKTELALEWYYRRVRYFTAAFWVNASDPAHLASEYAKIAKKLGLVTSEKNVDTVRIIELMKRWFEEARLPWLICFDNARDIEALQEFWPVGAFGKVLITRRNPCMKVSSSFRIAGVELGPLLEQDATYLFSRAAGAEAYNTKDKLLEVVRTLGCLPLAIDHMGGIVNAQNLTFATFLKYYRVKYYAWSRQDMSERETHWGKELCRYGATLANTWRFDDMASNSLRILRLLSVFDPLPVPTSLLLRADASSRSSLLFNDEQEVKDAWEAISQSSTIFPGPYGDEISIHTIISQQVRACMSVGEEQMYFLAGVNMLSRAFGRLNNDGETYEVGDSLTRLGLLPHTCKIFDHYCFYRQIWPGFKFPTTLSRLFEHSGR